MVSTSSMVSQLKTWKHQEPKGLWPALGGLAVVAHVGVLGLSLPYMLELMEPDGLSAQSTVPIELVDVENEATAEEATDSAKSTPKPEQTEPEQAEPAQASTPEPSQPAKTETAPETSNSTVVAEAGDIATSQNADQPGKEAEPEEEADENSESDERTVEDPTDSSANETPPEESNEFETTGNADESAAAEGGSNEGTTDPEETPPEETPPVVAGDSDLPSPNSGENTSAESFAYLNIVGHEYVPVELQRDLPDTPPSPLYESGTSLTINPQDTRCGQVDFSQQQVTYRVTIGKEGSLIGAIPWTGGIEEQPMSTGESAIACLLTSANFSFTPATKEGDPVASSNLLLNINVLESQQN